MNRMFCLMMLFSFPLVGFSQTAEEYFKRGNSKADIYDNRGPLKIMTTPLSKILIMQILILIEQY